MSAIAPLSSPAMAPDASGGELAGKHILVALSGGIAGYKIAQLVRDLGRAGATVQVMMSDAAQRFITPLTLQTLSGREVITSSWQGRAGLDGNAMPHINATREADLMLVAPASANTLAQIALGLSDSLIGLTALARPPGCPLAVAPAMNREMWANPATQRHVRQLAADGIALWGPASGDQACGETGDGRMIEPAELLERCIAALTPKTLAGRRVLVSAGPSFEALDPVRGLTNRSSGKMGFAIARAAAQAGAEVTLLAGPVSLPTPVGVRRVDFSSAQQLLDAALPLADQNDVFIATAAVADWRPVEVSTHKIKKAPGSAPPAVAMTENPDVLATLAALPRARSGQLYCVGFAAESQNLVELASAKRLRKGIPLIVGNLGPDTFGRDDNSLTLIDASGAQTWPTASKTALARRLVDEIARRLPPSSTAS
ncbi:bifunctional phosphopantothenoylcysteine decarboxylase/phosphopantothenate--cysteine ligase CoaBC [Amphibiibacter pelophylacis]|uniref:Bifunctional phosphopantothenoylcysteine decarboxylase/phosphopantothenate--cysteine ligase CoaBC n=1 Tax=Amphibiibacter pelophylacis TaxID=1799477 RepID=A0ACC6P4Z6_9BURK